jgi:hypothetical protein
MTDRSQPKTAPWSGDLSVDLRKGALSVSADGLTLIDANGVCWGIVFPSKDGFYDHAAFIAEAVNNHEALKARIQELEELGQFLVDRLEEFDPGDDQPEREFHGHVAPAAARLRSALQPKDGAK